MKKGFTLIELLIVIAIMAMFGMFVFGNLQQREKSKKSYTVSDLRKALEDSGDSELLCIDKCSKCFIHPIGSSDMNEVASDLKEISAYIVDKGDNAQKIEFGRWKDHRICLRYRHYVNGSTTQIILESEEKFFYLPGFFGEVKEYESLEDAVQEWISGADDLRDKGTYY